MEINVKGVKITLTKEQLQEIQKQTEENIFTATTYEEVCRRLGEHSISSTFFSGINIPIQDISKITNYAKLKQIERYFNQGWTPNWKDSNEYKYYPYFKYNSSCGFSFICSYCGCACFIGGLCYFKSEKISNHMGKHFSDLYKELL